MGRRLAHGADDDSLELLLDTICNVFGGMVLMAILVVLQTQAAADRVPAATPEAQSAALEARRLSHLVSEAKATVADLGSKRVMVEESYEGLSSPQTKDLLDRRGEFLEAIDRTQAKLEETESAAKKNDAEKQELDQQASELTEATEEAQRLRRELAGRARASRRTAAEKIRLPYAHEPRGRLQISFMVVGNRFYPLESDHVRVKPLRAFGARLFTPRDGRGYPATPKAFLSELGKYSRGSYFVSFWVRCDSSSFSAFQDLREVAVGKGFEYSVDPYARDRGLVLSPGGPPVQ